MEKHPRSRIFFKYNQIYIYIISKMSVSPAGKFLEVEMTSPSLQDLRAQRRSNNIKGVTWSLEITSKVAKVLPCLGWSWWMRTSGKINGTHLMVQVGQFPRNSGIQHPCVYPPDFSWVDVGEKRWRSRWIWISKCCKRISIKWMNSEGKPNNKWIYTTYIIQLSYNSSNI